MLSYPTIIYAHSALILPLTPNTYSFDPSYVFAIYNISYAIVRFFTTRCLADIIILYALESPVSHDAQTYNITTKSFVKSRMGMVKDHFSLDGFQGAPVG